MKILLIALLAFAAPSRVFARAALPERDPLLPSLVLVDQVCLGVIVARNLILTATHCYPARGMSLSFTPAGRLRLARIKDVHMFSKDPSCAPAYRADRVAPDRDYDEERLRYDARQANEYASVCYGREDIVLVETEGAPFSAEQILPVAAADGADIPYSAPFFASLREDDGKDGGGYYLQHRLHLIKSESSRYPAGVRSLGCVPDELNRLFIGCLPVRGNSGGPVLGRVAGRWAVVGVLSNLGLNVPALSSDEDFDRAIKQEKTFYRADRMSADLRSYLRREGLIDGTDPRYPFAIHAAWVTREIVDKIDSLAAE